MARDDLEDFWPSRRVDEFDELCRQVGNTPSDDVSPHIHDGVSTS